MSLDNFLGKETETSSIEAEARRMDNSEADKEENYCIKRGRRSKQTEKNRFLRHIFEKKTLTKKLL